MNDRTMVAAMAMQGMLANPADDNTIEGVAKASVDYADALLKALAETEAGQDDSPPVVDEVGDWRKYTDTAYKRYVRQLADGYLLLAAACFTWDATPQGVAFWAAVNNGTASAADNARARDFARRVLEAMEEEHG